MLATAGAPKHPQNEIDVVDGWQIERTLDIAADAHCWLPEWDAHRQQPVRGEKRRVALCRLLLSKPDMLLLTSQPTILMRKAWRGLNASCRTTPARRRNYP